MLARDVDLAELGTVKVEPFAALDCRGHRLYTSAPGTGIAMSQRSRPEVGLVLEQVRGASVRNCVVEGFDFPVFVLDSDLPAADAGPADRERLANDLVHDTIVGRYTAVTLLSSDDTRILGSTIVCTAPGCLGVAVFRDSDDVQIKGNTIVVPNGGPPEYVRFPGPELPSNPRSTGGSGGLLVTQGSGLTGVVSFVIDGQLHQSLVVDDPQNNPSFPERTVIADNTVVTSPAYNAIGVSAALATRIHGNTVTQARIGILFGANTYQVSFRMPARCSLDAARACVGNGDCFIPGIDTGSHGTCAASSKQVNWLSEDPDIEDNTILGPVNTGMQIAARRPVIRGNRLIGPLWPGTTATTDGAVGLDLRRVALETAIVMQNTVSGFPAALRILSNASFFGAEVSCNDFAGNRAHILTDRAVMLPAELSVGGAGNYWGLACADSGGFDESQVLFSTLLTVDAAGEVSIGGSPASGILDSHPFGEPVAGLDMASLPPSCPPAP